MLHAKVHISDYQSPITNPNPGTGAKSSSKSFIKHSDTSGILTDKTPLTNRLCQSSLSAPLHQPPDYPPPNRQQLGGKGMFLHRMQAENLSVPPFRCVTAQVMNALEQHTLDIHCLAPYLPDIVDALGAETSLVKITEYLNALPPEEQTKRNNWLAGLARFVASSDFYQQVEHSEAARQIRVLRSELDASQPVIVRSSGINEDSYG
ncbi:PEP/pyruvate-binding domain-containing protein, partial [Endozoicomonas sp. YOMI1]|uniref:PEP/pyruvate-binding domain-containing protein n=1 Tax=Endozoicomonas sp. YOMI1 TaxID=2828739 RepID=UPI0021484CA6